MKWYFRTVYASVSSLCLLSSKDQEVLHSEQLVVGNDKIPVGNLLLETGDTSCLIARPAQGEATESTDLQTDLQTACHTSNRYISPEFAGTESQLGRVSRYQRRNSC